MSWFIHLVIFFKAINGWFIILFPPSVQIIFVSLLKSSSGWIAYIQQQLTESHPSDNTTTNTIGHGREINRLRQQLNELQFIIENLRRENGRWQTECTQLTDERNELREQLRLNARAREMGPMTTDASDEISKLVEKLDVEKKRMKTSYEYFNGLSMAHKQKEAEWNAEKTKLAFDFVTERAYYELELKKQNERMQAAIRRKDDEHKTQIQQLLQQFDTKNDEKAM